MKKVRLSSVFCSQPVGSGPRRSVGSSASDTSESSTLAAGDADGAPDGDGDADDDCAFSLGALLCAALLPPGSGVSSPVRGSC